MHHARHHQIHALGAAIVERVRDAMREESAVSGTEQLFLRHPATRQQGMPWHGTSFEGADSVSPELGLWLKESAHGQGFGREVVAALMGDSPKMLEWIRKMSARGGMDDVDM